jgi:hypothetical protein
VKKVYEASWEASIGVIINFAELNLDENEIDRELDGKLLN